MCERFLDNTYHPQELSSRVVQHLHHLWASGACVDEHTMDQLVIYMVLAKGRSRIVGPPPPLFTSIHLETGVHISTLFTGVGFEQGVTDKGCRFIECEGIAYGAPAT